MRTPKNQAFIGNLVDGQLHPVKPFRFAEDDEEDLLAVLSERLGYSGKDWHVRRFLRAVERAAGAFKLRRRLTRDRPKAGATRAQVKRIERLARSLITELKTASAHTRSWLESRLQSKSIRGERPLPGRKKGSTEATSAEIEAEMLAAIKSVRSRGAAARAFVDHLVQVLATFDAAIAEDEIVASKPKPKPKESDGIVKRDSRKTHWRLEFAESVVMAYRRHLRAEPTSTEESPVAKESTFDSVLGICLRAVGVKLKSVHALSGKAIRNVKVQLDSNN